VISVEFNERAKRVLVDGGSSASRGSLAFHPYPPYIARGQGSRLHDVDGNSYIDWMMAFGALPLGHAHPTIVAAATKAVSEGIHFAAATSIEIDLAEAICALVPTADKVRFCNSGTEAVMAAVRLARGVTGRRKIIKFEGHYHGWADSVLVSTNSQKAATLGHPRDPVPIIDSSGIPPGAVEDTIVVPWNDIDILRHVMQDKGREIACVMTEGIMANMGVILPKDGYLQKVQSLCRAHGALFYIDETCTGFRVAPGGCAELFGLEPDLVSFGKALGQGFPLAALCGRADIMDGLEWGKVMHYGTMNACRSLAAIALAGLEVQRADGNAGFRKLESTGNALAQGLRDVFRRQNRHAVICQNAGALLQINFTDAPVISDFRGYCSFVDTAKFMRFANRLRAHGIYMNPSNALHSVASTAHTNQDVEETLRAVAITLEELN
jgi:glutamate-1-semialdehyde 2,1-aminomutase